MTFNAKFIVLIHAFVDMLVEVHFGQLERDRGSRWLPSHELQEALEGYGRTLITLPDEAISLAEVYPVKG